MELSEACDKLAKLMKTHDDFTYSEGGPIQFFHDYLNNGETPAMALALVKGDYKRIKNPLPEELQRVNL